MPCINLNIAAAGPLLTAQISISVPRAQALTAAGAQLPLASTGTFLVDTGASGTCVDPALVASLGLQPTGRVPISTPSTGGNHHYCNQYDVSLFIPGAIATAGHFIPAIPVIETHLRGQGIDGLIGRDVLKECTLIYNGLTSMFTLAF